MLVSLFPRIDLTRGKHVDLDWPTFAATYLSKHEIRTRKDGELFSFAVYHDNPQRADINVRAVTGVVVDFDNKVGIGNDAHCVESPTLPVEHFDNLDGVTFAYYSTHSSTTEWPRWRLVIPLDREVLPNEWPAVFDGAMALLGRDEGIDTSCRDLSRAYYMPSVTPEHAEEAFSGFVAGNLCRVADLLSCSAVDVLPSNVHAIPAPANLKREEGRNNYLKAIAAAMIGRAAPIESIVLELLKEDAKHNPPLFTDRSEGYRGSAEAGALLFVSRIVSSLDARRVQSGQQPDPLWLRPIGDTSTAPPPGGQPADKFKTFCAGEVLSMAKPLRWVIRGLLVSEAINYLGGAPNVGKSALAIDWALSIASALPSWHGHPIKQRPVIYIAQEGRPGLPLRVLAWSQHKGVDVSAVPFFLMQNFVDLVQDMEAYARWLAENFTEPFVVVDTQAASLPGADENESSAMTMFLTNIRRWFVEFAGGSVLVIHHSPKANPWELRGSGAIKGATESVLMVGQNAETEGHELRPSKLRDGTKIEVMHYTPKSEPLRWPSGEPMLDEFGDQETAVILDWHQKVQMDPVRMAVLQTIRGTPGIGKRALREAIQRRHADVQKAVDWAVSEGRIRVDESGQGHRYFINREDEQSE